MTQAKIALAVIEAKRFLCAAEIVLARKGDANDHLWASKETARVRRASMDLTRALAVMRNQR